MNDNKPPTSYDLSPSSKGNEQADGYAFGPIYKPTEAELAHPPNYGSPEYIICPPDAARGSGCSEDIIAKYLNPDGLLHFGPDAPKSAAGKQADGSKEAN